MTNPPESIKTRMMLLSMNKWTVSAFSASTVALALACSTSDPSQSEDVDSGSIKIPSITASGSAGESNDEEESDSSDEPSNSEDPSASNDDDDATPSSDDDDDATPSSDDDDDDDVTPSSDDDDDDDNDDGPKFDLGSIPDVEIEPTEGCDIDFLFVIDNSGSMHDEQVNVAASVPDFIETITSEIKDLNSFHIGVISTDDAIRNGQGGPCAKLGGLTIETLSGGTPGPFPMPPAMTTKCGPYASGKNFMNEDDDLGKAFDCAAKLGTFGAGNERPFDALKAALSDDLTSAGACNEGFLRKDAVLVSVLITDEEDDHETPLPPIPGIPPPPPFGSEGEPADWHKVLMAAKDDRPEFVVQLSLIGTEKPNECTNLVEPGQGGMLLGEGAEISPRIREYTELFGDNGVVGDVCAKNYDPFFESAVSVIKLACDSIPQG